MRFLLVLFVIAVSAALMSISADAHRGGRALVSWYGPGLYGNAMGCGGTLRYGTVGVAHKSLPCGSYVTICYRKCARLRVLDRGPFIHGRTFDITSAARYRIGMSGGVVSVRWWKS